MLTLPFKTRQMQHTIIFLWNYTRRLYIMYATARRPAAAVCVCVFLCHDGRKNVHIYAKASSLRCYLSILHSCALTLKCWREKRRASEKMMMASAFCAELQIETMMNCERESWIKKSGAHTHTYSGGGLEGFPAAKMRPGSERAYCAKYVCVLSARTQILVQRTAAQHSMCLAFEYAPIRGLVFMSPRY